MNATSFEALTVGLRSAIAEAEALLKSTANGAGDQVNVARDRARESLRRVRAHMAAAEREIVGHAHSLDRAVHANPWQAIAATGVVAFLLGYWMRRR